MQDTEHFHQPRSSLLACLADSSPSLSPPMSCPIPSARLFRRVPGSRIMWSPSPPAPHAQGYPGNQQVSILMACQSPGSSLHPPAHVTCTPVGWHSECENPTLVQRFPDLALRKPSVCGPDRLSATKMGSRYFPSFKSGRKN